MLSAMHGAAHRVSGSINSLGIRISRVHAEQEIVLPVVPVLHAVE